ncbi:hypothetical protein ABTN75_20110, partial [Acinetobacter baumannii]
NQDIYTPPAKAIVFVNGTEVTSGFPERKENTSKSSDMFNNGNGNYYTSYNTYTYGYFGSNTLHATITDPSMLSSLSSHSWGLDLQVANF